MRRCRSLLELPVELIREILLRIPPDQPECVVRKAWRGILSDPAFCRRYREFHHRPPLLGFINSKWCRDHPRFAPTTAFRPHRLGSGWSAAAALDARHGRVIFGGNGANFLIWDPVTGAQCPVPEPPSTRTCLWRSVAVLSTADGRDRLDCPWGPSLVAFVSATIDDTGAVTSASARLYSTEAGAWSDATAVQVQPGVAGARMRLSKVLVGNALYFICYESSNILWYDVVSWELSVMDPPEEDESTGDIVLMAADDGVLVYARVQEHRLQLWSRETGPDGALAWAQRRVIQLQPQPSPSFPLRSACVVGFMDGGAVIFLSVSDGLFTIEISSGKLRKVSNCCFGISAFPYTSFYNLDELWSFINNSEVSVEKCGAFRGKKYKAFGLVSKNW